MKEIERLIQFAIDNGYDDKRYIRDKEFQLSFNQYNDIHINASIGYKSTNIEKVITSKPFIEAVVRGVFDNNELLENFSRYYYGDAFYYTNGAEGMQIILDDMSNDICKFQAIAIRDNKLPEFINNLLGE